MTTEIGEIRITVSKLKKLVGNPEATAKAGSLVYVQDQTQGIVRSGSNKRFTYSIDGKRIKDKNTLLRIKKLAIPPAWTEVWICADENGHIQATGVDAMGRKQYRYHPFWSVLRNHTKFYRLLAFGEALPAMRKRIEKDLAQPNLTETKVLALVITLMEKTGIRIGSEFYEKLYGSFGLTTLKDKHVCNTEKGKLEFCFKGKKGITHTIALNSKKLAKLVQQCKDIPGKELFQYYDEAGKRQCIDSGMVNNYIKEISGQDFTAKDFRTWAGTREALLAFKTLGAGDSPKEIKQKMLEALDMVSAHLGNTRTVCKKYYVHPTLMKLYEEQKLAKLLEKMMQEQSTTSGLSSDESLLLSVLAAA